MPLSLRDLLDNPPDLPVAKVLCQVREDLEAADGLAVIQAPPGTGKTTLIPPLVAQWIADRGARDAATGAPSSVIVTQPRRVAARAAARRIANLLGEPVGETVGFSVRGETKRSARTRIEMVTPGVLVRRLQANPELPGVSAIILDEIHERHLDSDLALAFAADVRGALRPDLALIAMSATVEAQATARVLSETGGAARIVSIPGEIFPLDIHFAAPPSGCEPLGAVGRESIGVRREFLGHVTRTVARALRETSGNILVFLPGVREVDAVATQLRSLDVADDLGIFRLHGSLPAREQDAALADPYSAAASSGEVSRIQRRVIVSTAIAESSLTVPGVSVVVDAGLSREPRTDYSNGISGLVTVLESQAAGIQRAGRAGRLGPGTVYRTMSEATWARLASQSEPEINTADLTDFLLQLAVWGTPRGEGLPLLDPPPNGAIESGERTLRGLELIHPDGSAKPEASIYARFPMDPRLARGMLRGVGVAGEAGAARIGAALADDPRVAGADFTTWRRAVSPAGSQQAKRLQGALREAIEDLGAQDASRPDAVGGASSLTQPAVLAAVIAPAFPDRLARIRPSSDPAHPSLRYLLTCGAGATLPENSPLIGEEWLAISSLTSPAGRADAMIRAAVPISGADAIAAGEAMLETRSDIVFERNRLRGSETEYLGAIELSTRPLKQIPEQAAREWIARAVADGSLPIEFSEDSEVLRQRLAFLHEVMGEPWPDVSRSALAARLEELAGPELSALSRGGTFRSLTAEQLKRIFPWPEAAKIDELAPTSITIPTGERRRIDYSRPLPTVRLRVQEAFGWKSTPRIAGGKVPITLELLSPAQRPVAITDDLASFWAGAYADVRAEMRGRYPKHPWPDDGANALPTNRIKRRR